MQLTKHTDYALRVLMYVGVIDDRPATISEIGEAYDISKEHLRKVTHRLGQLGYVRTQRGRGGGLRLAREPNSISIGQLVRDMDENLAITECLAKGGVPCRINDVCGMKCALRGAIDKFVETLDNQTLADFLVEKPAIRESLAIT